MKILRRVSVNDRDGLDFVLSDGSLDRHGTKINPSGWDLENFKRNPIALFGHDSDFPIGTWEDIRVKGGKLLGTLKLAAKGTSARLDELISLVEQKILRAVSVGFSVLEEGVSGKSDFHFEKQELIEASVVAVGSNTNALAKARALGISESTIQAAFGEQAERGRQDATPPGEHADPNTAVVKRAQAAAPPRPKEKTMNLSQRIEAAQADLNTKRDKLVELTGAEAMDLDAIEELNGQIETVERTIATLKVSEQRSAGATLPIAAPAVRRPLGVAQREVNGLDLMVRQVLIKGVTYHNGMTIEKALDRHYPGHELTHIVVTRADQTIGTTTVAGWALEVVQTQYSDFLPALMPFSVYPAMRSRGIGLSFDGVGTVSIPSRTAGGAGGGFVAEGSPIRVGRITTAATTMTPRKLGVIIPFSRELAKRSTPAIEGLVRQAILEDTGIVLDAALLDATAASTARPAGLLNGVSAVASGYGGGDYQAVIADLKALLAPFYSANAGDNITVLMNPAQGLSLSMMPGPGPVGEFGWSKEMTGRLNIIESTNVTAGRLIAVRTSDFATALGDAPEFDISEQATVHMEDSVPLEIVSGTGPTTADPVRSFFQTATIGVRMIMEVSWKMRRTGMVQWVDSVSW